MLTGGVHFLKGTFKNYLRGLYNTALRGDASEVSFYSTLATMLEEFSVEVDKTYVKVTTLPKSTEAGIPDLRLWNGRDRIIGYIEAKKPSEINLDHIETTEQLQRYRASLPNLILTNFLEFRLYRNGELVDSVYLAKPNVLNILPQTKDLKNPEALSNLLNRFLDFSLPKAFNAETLAIELAKRACLLKEVIQQQLNEEKTSPGVLTGFYEAFEHYLMGDLTEDSFTDLYAQTITYGLFAARTRIDNDFNRQNAIFSIPHTIGVLRDLFQFISFGNPPRQLEWAVDDIVEVLAIADVSGILETYYRNGSGGDPIVHFYETFLAKYNPEERERRGVYYTPESVVSYIVRSLNKILKDKFGISEGLADKDVTLLDPAAGTMTFIATAALIATQEFESNYGSGGKIDFIKDHILKNFFAFELLVAPYAIGHMKMGFFLNELGYSLGDSERTRFYLTNTLNIEDLEQTRLPGLSSLAEESRLAGQVKNNEPILVVLGNPPYSIRSTNQQDWILEKVKDYKKVDGAPLGERNPSTLRDDYVKFLRFAQWKIEEEGHGVVGMITNHSYLDNPTSRGMRHSLMRTFDEIFILDLHGNTHEREVCPDGSRDENVFDILQGVAIAFFIKYKESNNKSIVHLDLWGLRDYKYSWLNENDISSKSWNPINPKPPFYNFIPQDFSGIEHYEKWIVLPQIFLVNSTGIKTHRDHFVMDMDYQSLNSRIMQFIDPALADNIVADIFNLKDTGEWKLSEKRSLIQKDKDIDSKFIRCFYRPFDARWLFYHLDAIERGRYEVMKNMLSEENVCITFPRSISSGKPFNHVLCAKYGVLGRFFPDAASITYFAPLYIDSSSGQQSLHTIQNSSTKLTNINPLVIQSLESTYKSNIKPENVFYYIYAVLHAPSYREKYAIYLRNNFPRIPFTSDLSVFEEVSTLGKRLVDLHLLKSTELEPPTIHYEGVGDGRIAKSKTQGFQYDIGSQRIYINKHQYFEPIPEEIWEYEIGGYQVCLEWLRARKGLHLTLEDMRNYCQIVSALNKTLAIQKEIDDIYPAIEKKVII